VNNGDVYIAAASLSNNYPVTNTSTNKGRNDFVVTKFNSAGTIVYSTYIGTSKNDVEVLDFKVENGEAYFVSLVQGTDYPTTNGSVNSGGTDIVLTKFDTNGNVAYATYLGSSSFESSTYLTVLNGEAYVMSGTDGSNFPTTDGSGPRGGSDITLTKFSTTGDICYSTQIGGSSDDFSAYNQMYVDPITKDAFIMGYSNSNDYPTTTGINNTAGDKDLVFTKLKLCPTITATGDLLLPNTQTQCKFGLGQTIVGKAFTYPTSSMPIIYRNGATSGQNQIDEVTYQWQIAAAAAGPWTDISGAILRDYLPSLGGTNQYYRRVTTTCCGTVALSISDVVAVLVNANTAPTVSVGDNYNTCPSQAVTIGGAPTATGGTAPYTYVWDNGATAVANPSVSPTTNTIYTVTVTDALGCKQIDQAVVNTHCQCWRRCRFLRRCTCAYRCCAHSRFEWRDV
jgi:hypothetical protein